MGEQRIFTPDDFPDTIRALWDQLCMLAESFTEYDEELTLSTVCTQVARGSLTLDELAMRLAIAIHIIRKKPGFHEHFGKTLTSMVQVIEDTPGSDPSTFGAFCRALTCTYQTFRQPQLRFKSSRLLDVIILACRES